MSNDSNEKSDDHYVKATRVFTLVWGIIAILFATFGTLVENLIQLVNIIGSIFYGNILGIFLIAFFLKFIQSKAVFISAFITQAIVIGLYFLNEHEIINLPYLWLNFVGCIIVILIAILLTMFDNNSEELNELN